MLEFTQKQVARHLRRGKMVQIFRNDANVLAVATEPVNPDFLRRADSAGYEYVTTLRNLAQLCQFYRNDSGITAESE